MEPWHLEVAERLARIEANQEYLKLNMRNLPQSDVCAAEIAVLRTDIHDLKISQQAISDLKKEVSMLKDFRDAINTKVAYIGGVLVMVGVFVPYAIKWVVDHLHFRFP